MLCQLCLAGAVSTNLDENSLDDLKTHSEWHRSQVESAEKYFALCFPNLANKIIKVEDEINFATDESNIIGLTGRVEDHSYNERIDVSTGSESSRQNRQTAVQSYCTQLIKEFGASGKLACRLCSKQVYIGRGTSNVIRHTMSVHCELKLYTCRFCSQNFSAINSVNKHIRLSHKNKRSSSDRLWTSNGGYIDRSQEYEEDVIDLLAHCYEKSEGGDEKKGDD